jgi:hypothetical protein
MANNIKVATIDFWCAKCGTQVRVGENYIDDNGKKLCMCALPERRLKATGARRPAVVKEIENEKAMDHLRIQNIKMRLDLEVLIENPTGNAAKKIIARYKRLRKIRNEQYLSNLN